MSLVLALAILVAAPEDGADAVRREILAAEAGAAVGLLEALPQRMAAWPAAERKALAPFLAGLLRDRDRVRLHAALLAPLVESGTDLGIRLVLSPFFDRESPELRAVARAALIERGGEEATTRIAEFLRRDASARARAHLALVLGERADRSGATTLVGALSDPSAMVRAAAAESLTRLTGVCRGYDPAAWRPLPAPKAPPVEPVDPGPGAPGEVVTAPRGPEEDPPGPPVGDLVPTFHGIPLDRPAVIVVLDFSGSVQGPGADRVRAELGTALSLLPSVRRFTVIAFDERMLVFEAEAVPAEPDAKERLLAFLDDLPPGRRTELLLPVRSGIALAAGSPDGAQVLLVSDGAPTVASAALDDLLDRAEGLSAKGVRVDAAVFGGRSVGLFRHLARITGGDYVALPSPR